MEQLASNSLNCFYLSNNSWIWHFKISISLFLLNVPGIREILAVLTKQSQTILVMLHKDNATAAGKAMRKKDKHIGKHLHLLEHMYFVIIAVDSEASVSIYWK